MFAARKARLVVKHFAPEALEQTSSHWVLYGTTGIRISASFHGFSGEMRFLGLSGCFLNVLSSGRSCFSRAPDPAQTPSPAPRLPPATTAAARATPANHSRKETRRAEESSQRTGPPASSWDSLGFDRFSVVLPVSLLVLFPPLPFRRRDLRISRET